MRLEEEKKGPELVEEVDTYYQDIAAQLAKEIEEEERKEREREE